MRKLHLVGLTADRKGLIFTARKGSQTGGYVVPLEDDFLDAIAEAQRRRNGTRAPARRADEPRVGSGSGSVARRSNLTPREIQARLRAGRSAEAVADEAEVDVEWVERFAVPIFAEQAQVVELARTLIYAKPRGDDSDAPLDEAVAWNLLDRGITLLKDEFAASWGAYQLHDQVWLVRFEYRSKGRPQHAEWEVDVRTGELTARNRLAGELAYVEKGRPRRLAAGVPGGDDDEAGDEAGSVEAAGKPAAVKAAAAVIEPEPEPASALVEPATTVEEATVPADEPVDAEAPDEVAEAPEIAETAEEVETGEEFETGEEVQAGGALEAAVAEPEGPVDAVADKAPAPEPGPVVAPAPTPKRSRAAKAPRAAKEASEQGTLEPVAAEPDAPAPAAVGTRSPARALSRTGRRPWYAADAGAPMPEPARPPAKNRTDRAAKATTKSKVATGAGVKAGSAPGPDGSGPAKAATTRKSQAKTLASTKTTAPAKTAAAVKPAAAQSGADAPPPAATPGGAGVRMAVAKVTTARVAASRALVARAVTSQPPAVQTPRPQRGPGSPLRQRASQQSRPAPAPERPAPARQQAAQQPVARQPGARQPVARQPADHPADDRSETSPESAGAQEPSRPPVRRPPPPSASTAPERRPAPRTDPPDPLLPFADQEATGRFRILPADAPPAIIGDDDDYAPPPPTVRPFTPRPAPTGPARVNSRSEAYDDEDDDAAWGDAGSVGGSTAYESRPRISASPAGDWRPLAEPPKRRSSGGAPSAPPSGIDEPRSRRRKRRSRPS